jgi:adenylate cyclase
MEQEQFHRKLTAILSADACGYSRLMGDDEEVTVKQIIGCRAVMKTIIEKHGGRVVDAPGDNLLAEFSSVLHAVRSAVEMQEEFRQRNDELSEDRRMEFRIGINLGDVIQEGDRIYGDGVNIAARIESLAEPGGICISGTVYEHIKHKLAIWNEYLGEHEVKNIREPVSVYRIDMNPPEDDIISAVSIASKFGNWRRAALAGAAAVILVLAGLGAWSFFSPSSSNNEAYTYTKPGQGDLLAKPSIAVLPFNNLSSDPEQSLFADSVSEQLIIGLATVPHIDVAARKSSFAYKGKAIKVQEISRDLGVKYVLEGSVQRSGSRIRVTILLTNARTGRQVWAQKYDREISDIFALQDEITQEILSSLQVKLSDEERSRIQASGRSSDRLGAYEKTFRKAVLEEPNNAKAWNNLGLILRMRDKMQEAVEAYKRSCELDASFAVAYKNLGVALEKTKDPAGAADAYFKYAEAAPNAPDAKSVKARAQWLKTQKASQGASE